MNKKPVIIIVEDDENWLNILSETITTHFKVKLEAFSSFFDAEKRLLKKPVDFDLLVTDIFPSNKSREIKGLKFANFANEIINVPVIIVTGEVEYVNTSLRDYNVIDAFDKGRFERIDFINSVSKVIKPNRGSKDLSDADYLF